MENLYLDEVVIPANTRISATCTVSSRLTVSISSFEFNGKVYAGNYMGYDVTDCKPGIYCSQAEDMNSKRVQREAIGTGARTARNVLAYGGVIGSLASDAVGLAQTIGSTEIMHTQVDVPAGFEFYIKKSKR